MTLQRLADLRWEVTQREETQMQTRKFLQKKFILSRSQVIPDGNHPKQKANNCETVQNPKRKDKGKGARRRQSKKTIKNPKAKSKTESTGKLRVCTKGISGISNRALTLPSQAEEKWSTFWQRQGWNLELKYTGNDEKQWCSSEWKQGRRMTNGWT